MKRVHIKIFGDVQGVGFRSLAQHRAKKLGVNGWVRNNQDGTVEAVFEGEDSAVDDMIEWCKQGPPTSHVEKIETSEEKFYDEFKSFEIIC